MWLIYWQVDTRLRISPQAAKWLLEACIYVFTLGQYLFYDPLIRIDQAPDR